MERRLQPVLLAVLAVAVVTGTVAAGSSPERDALAQRVVRAAVPLAQSRVAAPDRFEVDSARFGGADSAPDAPVVLEPAEVSGPNQSGVVQATFRMIVGGVPVGRARAVVRGKVRGPALRAVETLTRDRVLEAPDVEIADCDLTRVAGSPLRAADEALGLVPVRTLGAGRVLTAELVEPAPTVRRGEIVELRYEADRLRIKIRARALRNGVPGDVVPVENPASGIELLARIQDDGSLTVVR